jgi:hypothetical protein
MLNPRCEHQDSLYTRKGELASELNDEELRRFAMTIKSKRMR